MKEDAINMGFQSFKMIDGSTSGEEGLIEDHVGLEDDSINFWATLGVSPHVHVVEPVHPIAPGEQMVVHPQSFELAEQSIRKELFPIEADPRLEPFLGMEFDSGEAAKTFYIAYAGRVGFSVRIARSRRSKCNESVIMLRFVCSKEGFCREKRIVEGKKTRKRAASVREGCRAMLEVVRRGDGKWIVTKLVKEHNHEVGLPSKVHYIATEGDAEMEPYLGMEFDSLEVAKTFYYSYASRVGFEARVRQSRRSLHDETLKMLKLVCSKHRYHSGRDNNNSSDDIKMSQLLDSSKEGCEALFEIIRKDDARWMVSKLVLEHSHELTPSSSPSKVRCVRSQGEMLVIAKNFEDTRNLLLNGQDSRYPREVRYNDLGPEDVENLLEYFTKTQEENPVFFHVVQVEVNNSMTNIFWTDAKARMAYSYFGDAVTLDTTYRNDRELIPFVTFTGVNHHAQPVVFGCALLVDDSEASYTWLFETWLSAMPGRHPVSLITDLGKAIVAAAGKVLPNIRHCFNKGNIIKTVWEELPDVSAHTPFAEELQKCVDVSPTSESFESSWNAIISKYDLGENAYLQFLYSIRHQWVPLFFKGTFFADISSSQRSENLDKAVRKYFTSKTPLRLAVRQLGQAIASDYEKEAQEDFVSMYNKPFLRTASPIEKQAAGIYTKTIFDKFQVEFVECFGYRVDRLEDGEVKKFSVTKGDDAYAVTFDSSETKVQCSCNMFEYCGILCRHALKIFMVENIRRLPKDYILKRWTKYAKNVPVVDECGSEFRATFDEPSAARYDDLHRDAINCAREGATSLDLYTIAKDVLQKALAELVSARQRKEQQTLQSFLKSQKKQNKRVSIAVTNDVSRTTARKLVPKDSLSENDTR